MTSSNPSPLPCPAASSHRSVWSGCHLAALISHGKTQRASNMPRAPGISCWHEHGGKNVQVCHLCKFQNTLRKNSKCPKKEFMTQGSQQKGLKDLSWFVRWMPGYCSLFRLDQNRPDFFTIPDIFHSVCISLGGFWDIKWYEMFFLFTISPSSCTAP